VTPSRYILRRVVLSITLFFISPYSLQSRSQVLQEAKNQSLQVERFDTHLVNLYYAFLSKW